MTPMLREGLAVAVASVLGVLSALHLYWVAGGRRGMQNVIPEVPGKGQAFSPGPGATLAVALALLGAAAVVLARVGVIGADMVPTRAVRMATWAIAIAFGLRAIGDFRLVGVFKRIRGTSFAWWDSRLFVPLCCFLSIGAAVVAAG